MKAKMIRKIVPKTAIIAVALGALASAALAEPVKLTEAQMDQVVAGAFIQDGNNLRDINGIVYALDLATGFFTDSMGKSWGVSTVVGGVIVPTGMNDLTTGLPLVDTVLTDGQYLWDGGYAPRNAACGCF